MLRDLSLLLVSSVYLTRWGQLTHICICKLTIIVSDNGLSPGWCQAIIWNNAGILLIGHLYRNKCQWIFYGHSTFSFKKNYFKTSSGKWQPFCLSLNVLNSFYVIDKHLAVAPLEYSVGTDHKHNPMLLSQSSLMKPVLSYAVWGHSVHYPPLPAPLVASLANRMNSRLSWNLTLGPF